MNICFIYEYGFAGNNGSNHLLSATIEKMLGRGHTVHLIQSVSSHENAEYPEKLEHPNFVCHSIESEKVEKTNFIKRYLSGVRFTKKAAKIAKTVDADLFFIQSVPTTTYLVKRLKKYKKPIVQNIHDVFPGSARALGVIKSGVLNDVFRAIQRKGFRLSDRIVVVSDDMRDVLIREKIDADKLVIINTWFDSDSIRYVKNEDNRFVSENGIDTSRLIIQYAGNVGQVFGLDEFVSLVNALKDNDKVEFHVVGQGVKLDSLRERTKDAHIRFFGWQPQERMSEIYSYCDIEIIPLRRGVIGNDVPSKMALAMACGKPVMNIVEDSGYYRLFEKNHIGYSFEQDRIEDAVKVINEISKDRSLLDGYGPDTIAFTNAVYSKDNNNRRLLDMLENLEKEWREKK
ncbi:MAG: glycosyltransferase family 4 protein [Clostridia bacterium]|nr:glycosyltransferase family 4 protein [Clostridia bacterium]